MRWVVQRELGSGNVYFHEVTIPPGTVEGTHKEDFQKQNIRDFRCTDTWVARG
jgi:hypothetical protein